MFKKEVGKGTGKHTGMQGTPAGKERPDHAISDQRPPSVSVVIPVYNGGGNFRRCLVSVVETVPSPDELIVVADGDTDGSWHLANQFGARTFRLRTPHGPASARNRGAREARGDVVLFLDADVVVPRNLIAQVKQIFQEAPHLTAVFGSYDDRPIAENFLSQYKNLLHHYIHQTGKEDASTFWGACGAVHREAFLAIGGFNERYRQPSIEDIELGYRLKRAGHHLRLCKTLQVTHLKRWGVLSLLAADFYRRALPWTDLILHRRGFINDLNLRMTSRLSIVLVFGLVAALGSAMWWPDQVLVIVGVLALGLLALNTPVYWFFWRKRGLGFALRALSWHWLYYFYSGVAFGLGTIRALWSGPQPASRAGGSSPPGTWTNGSQKSGIF